MSKPDCHLLENVDPTKLQREMDYAECGLARMR